MKLPLSLSLVFPAPPRPAAPPLAAVKNRSGRRPDTTRVWNFADHFRLPSTPAKGTSGGRWDGDTSTQSKPTGGPSWSSLPGYFLRHGYSTLGSGE